MLRREDETWESYLVYEEDLVTLNHALLNNSILEVTSYIDEKFTVQEAKQWIKDDSENLAYKRFKLALPLKVDHENESTNIAGEVKKFMKDNNWKSKTRFRKED